MDFASAFGRLGVSKVKFMENRAIVSGSLGHHFFCDVSLQEDQNSESFFASDFLLRFLQDLCKTFNFHVLCSVHQRFLPEGDSFLFLLSESHLALHTWPEKSFFSLDLFFCKELSAEALLKFLTDYFAEFPVLIKWALIPRVPD
jgi:S-adenosylmethionine/arginine decarboxylase-like enzyme